jgi:apolipoprotein N-acyltransferase
MAVMRGVESGFAIARSAKQGFMTISDNRGRILFESRSDTTGTAHVLGTIRLSGTQTFYARFGDWFAWLNLAALAALLFALSRKSSAPVTDSF